MFKKSIGENAGKIWSVHYDNKEMPINELKNVTKHTEKIVLLSLGWLSIEMKCYFLRLIVCLKFV